MEARVKETGKEFKVRGILTPTADAYAIEEVDLFFDESDQVELLYREDYWTRLEHQYAGMAMQGMMSYVEQITPKKGRSFCDEIVDISFKVAHALVEKMKEVK